jgi:chromosome segregation ATPase
MAKPPSKRRGIQLGYGADAPPPIDLTTAEPTIAVSLAPDQSAPGPKGEGGDLDGPLKTMAEQLAELRRINADLELRWKRQAEQMQQLEQARDEIALQTRQLQALQQSRQSSGRLGVLLALLALSGIAALGYHTWPQLQEVAGEARHVNTSVTQLAPQLQAVHEQVTSLVSDLGRMGSAMTSLREDVSGVHTDLGALHQTVDNLAQVKGPVEADARATRSAAHTLPRNATTMRTPYPPMHPMRPW